MLKKLINKIWKSEGQEDMATPSLEKASFQLVYKKLFVIDGIKSDNRATINHWVF